MSATFGRANGSIAVFVGGGIAATLDIVYAIVVNGWSAFPFKLSYPLPTLIRGFISHAVLVGVPIALSMRRFAGPAGSGTAI